MDVKIGKVVTVTINDKDVSTLKNICEMARIRIMDAKREHGITFVPQDIGLTEDELIEARALMTIVFDA